MKTKNEVLEAIKAGKSSECIDHRDFCRLAEFVNTDELVILNCKLNNPETKRTPIAWTRENFLIQLEKDLRFAFEKALNQRGISSSFMYEVIKMWLWILDDELYYNNEYAQYGLPLFKKVAIKYNFENPIGEDYGNENKYAAD